jgi:hypothetical protein
VDEVMIQTISVLAACLFFMTKQAYDMWRSKQNGSSKNGKPSEMDTATRDRLLRDLHEWHQPRMDPSTGQPRFFWYEDLEIHNELRMTREQMGVLTEVMKKCEESILKLAATIEKKNPVADE